jgi:hypothetical protein
LPLVFRTHVERSKLVFSACRSPVRAHLGH